MAPEPSYSYSSSKRAIASGPGLGSFKEPHASAVWFVTINGIFFEDEDE